MFSLQYCLPFTTKPFPTVFDFKALPIYTRIQGLLYTRITSKLWPGVMKARWSLEDGIASYV